MRYEADSGGLVEGGAVIEIDGSEQSGSGTVLRYAVVLSTLVREPLHITRIRARRDKPGLRPQHLHAVKACAMLSGGRLEGAEVDSQEITYWPGMGLKHGDFELDIGTAGSTTMLAFTLIPVSLFAGGPLRMRLVGGLFQDFAPSAFHMQNVLIPLARRMGADVRLEVVRPGYVPQGQGALDLTVQPLLGPLQALSLPDQGALRELSGISLASHLHRERVAERMAEESTKLLERKGLPAHIDVVHDSSAVQKGAALCIWAKTDTGAILGADQAGKPRRRSESIAAHVVGSLTEDLATGASTDRYLADQLILFAALANGATEYGIPARTDHVEANLWLVERILGARTGIEGNRLRVEGIGLSPSAV